MKTMKWSFVVLLAGVAIALALVPSFAQQNGYTAGSRVGVCDVVEIFNNYARADDLTAQLNERRQEIQAESEKRSQAIEGLQLEMEGLREGSEEYEQRFGEIQRMLVEREAWARYQEGMLMREHHRLTKEMYEQILDTIGQVSRERGFDVVLFHPRVEITSTNTQELLEQIQGRPVLYAAQGVDMTREVLTRLNNAYQATQTR